METSKCRICGGDDFERLFSLGRQPLANNFLQSNTQEIRVFPLKLQMCKDCKLVQLSDVVPAEDLYSNYNYIPSVSSKLKIHFKDLAEQVWDEYKLDEGDFIVDIGSNDGLLLSYFKSLGGHILGIEPAMNISDLAVSSGIPTINAFFSLDLAKSLIEKYGKAKIITATNVFAHVHDMHDFILGIKSLLDEDGVFIAEFPYLVDLLQNNEFDTIYHEHLSYFSIKPLVYLFSAFGLTLFNVEKTNIHGGSIVIYVSKKTRQISPNIEKFLELEESLQIYDRNTYRKFFKSIEMGISQLRKYIFEKVDDGQKIIGLGAAAKGTVLLNFARLNSDYIEYVTDNTPYKQGKFIPGTNIPIVVEQRMYQDNPDIALILAWNHSEEIIAKNSKFLENGGEFIIPVPSFRVISYKKKFSIKSLDIIGLLQNCTHHK